MTLTEFLLARIGEDQARALAATPSPWAWDYEDYADSIVSTVVDQDHDDRYVITTDSRVYGPNDITAEHIMAWAPHRVLAECKAKRRIVEQRLEGIRDDDPDTRCLSTVIEALAAVYADHPDYRAEWSLT